jgi:hypothetical protein
MSYTRRNGCPQGYTRRKGYTRRYKSAVKASGFTVRRKGTLYTVHPSKNNIVVGSTCVKAKAVGSMRIGKLRKGDLIKYGYQYRLSDRLRHAALKRAIDVYGALTVYHKIDAVAKLSVTVAPDAHHIFAKDREWIRANFKLVKQQ